MKEIVIGNAEDGSAVTLDIGRLIVGRLLATADSGGGKSWLLRKILESVSKTTQTIVIDTEGEFASLRELRDMVLAGPDGEVPAEPRSAALLCRRLMELNLSAVIDIQELTPRDRQAFVATFCTTLVDLPRSLWHRCFVAIDELHEFAPEGETSASEAAVAYLSSKGRKRGFCLIGATQRLSKLSKNVAAGLKNQFYGTFSLDADMKRAAGALGFGRDRWAEIRDLSSQKGHEGEFFAFGPAFNHRGVTKMRTGAVETTHPEAGVGRAPSPPAPSEKIKGVLAELKDIPQQAEAEIRDLASAKSKIATLERELKAKPAAPKPIETVKEVPILGEQHVKRLEGIAVKLQGEGTRMVETGEKMLAEAAAVRQTITSATARLAGQAAPARPVVASPARLPAPQRAPRTAPATTDGITPRQQRMLNTAATLTTLNVEVSRETVCGWLGIHPRGGSVGEELKALTDAGLIDHDRGRIVVTEAGMAAAEQLDASQAVEQAKAGLSPRQSRIFDIIVRAHPNSTTREAIAEEMQIHPRGGSFGEDLGRLVGRGLVEGRRGEYRARDFLFAGV